MKRVASLDLLRGLAAFSVAVPHYLTLNDAGHRVADVITIASVEVFFVLSGFVLAPQILQYVVEKPVRNLRIFLVRRWMRTIPPYLIALIAIAVVTRQLLTLDFLRDAFYVQNLFSQANINDFFPVAWSLSVEEWYYVTFAPILFLLARKFHRKDRRFALAFGIFFIGAIVIARLFGDFSHWDAEVRRVTVFRVDSVAWGFLLYIAIEHVAPFDTATVKGRLQFAGTVAIFVACCLIVALITYHTFDSLLSRRLFPFAAAAFGMSAVFFFQNCEFLFAGNLGRKTCIYLGHISYSVYLFHLLLAMVLKPRLAHLNTAIQIVVFIALLVGLTTALWRYVERPILAARPEYNPRKTHGYRAKTDRAAATQEKSLVVTLALIAVACVFIYYCVASFQGNHRNTFYLTFIAATGFMLAATNRIQIARLTSISLTLFFVSILMPAADFVFRKSSEVPSFSTSEAKESSKQFQPTYTFSSAKADPQAFHKWWLYYVDEWTKEDGAKRATEKPDPTGLLPFVLVPNSTGRFFNSVIHINNLGFRGQNISSDKQNRFRIFALGESPTFGPTLHAGDKTWPEDLQDLINARLACARPIEVINGGTEGYTLANNIERLRRDIIPLKPDLVISYHGYNGLAVLFESAPFSDASREPLRVGPSPILSEIIHRVRFAIYRLKQNPRTLPIYTQDQIMKSKYANNYRQLLQIAGDSGFRVVLTSSSMAVADSSPRDVKDFYGRVFPGIDETIVRNAAHNELVRKLAAIEKVPFIDTTPQLDGHWDDDLYLDLVHFTQAGNKRMAKVMFDGLSDMLRSDEKLKCSDRAAGDPF